MTKVLFIANFNLTELMSEISKILEDESIDCHFLSVSKFYSKKYLKDLPAEKLHEPEMVFNRKPNNFLNEDLNLSPEVLLLLKHDRVLRYWPEHASIKSLVLFQNWTRNLFFEEKFDYVIGESTWTFEKVVHEEALKSGARYLKPVSLRYPNNRWILCSEFGSNSLYKTFDPSNAQLDTSFLESISHGVFPKLDWMKTKRRKIGLTKISSRLFYKIWQFREARFNPTQLSFFDYFRSDATIRRKIRHLIFKIVNFLILPSNIFISEKNVFAPFHVQPEASIDVEAPHVSNQVDTIVKIANLLPEDWKLYCKDHPNNMGARHFRDYFRLIRHPKIRMFSARTKSIVLLKNASVIYSPTGTVCLEAAFLGLPCVMASTLFFSSLPTIEVSSKPWNSDWNQISDKRISMVQNQRALTRYFDDVIPFSFDGIWGSKFETPSALTQKNINQISEALKKVFIN